MSQEVPILSRVMATIEERKRNRPSGSYTARLLDEGMDRIGAKIIEEAAEVVEAAGAGRPELHREVIHEAADLVYHLLVLLAHCGVTLEEVETELARRHKPG